MPVQTITPLELSQRLRAGQRVDLIDVRTPIEFAEVHAEPARLIPLDELDPAGLLAARNGAGDEPIYFICKAGTRGGKACEKLAAAGCANVFNVVGGTDAWVEASLPVVRGKGVISLERQVRIGAGSLVLIGVSLGWFVHPGFFGLAAFVGAGLVFAGITNFCGMGMLLARMPWNRRLANTSCSAR